MSKLSDAIDYLQEIVDDETDLQWPDHDELKIVIEAAWKYYDLSEEGE